MKPNELVNLVKHSLSESKVGELSMEIEELVREKDEEIIQHLIQTKQFPEDEARKWLKVTKEHME